MTDRVLSSKPIILLDFDGCINSYKSGWVAIDKIPDPPVPGVFEWMEKALSYFEVHVYSSRSSDERGIDAMKAYIINHGGLRLASSLVYTDRKSSAFLTIDDRCIRFDGDWNDPQFHPEVLRGFVPWYKGQQHARAD